MKCFLNRRFMIPMGILAFFFAFGMADIKAEEAPVVASSEQLWVVDWKAQCYTIVNGVRVNGNYSEGTGEASTDPEQARANAESDAVNWIDGPGGCEGTQVEEWYSAPAPYNPIVRSEPGSNGSMSSSAWVVEYTVITGNCRTKHYMMIGATECETLRAMQRYICKYLMQPPTCGGRIVCRKVIHRPTCCTPTRVRRSRCR